MSRQNVVARVCVAVVLIFAKDGVRNSFWAEFGKHWIAGSLWELDSSSAGGRHLSG